MTAYGDAWVQEMWRPVRELSELDRARQHAEDAVARKQYEQEKKPADRGPK